MTFGHRSIGVAGLGDGDLELGGRLLWMELWTRRLGIWENGDSGPYGAYTNAAAGLR